jgi:hypothetical protein
MKIRVIYAIMALAIMLAGCEKDNYKEPTSTLSGAVTYNGTPLQLRSTGGFQLELWQRGYQLFSKIPVYVNWDGKYSAILFDGNYKMIGLNGTWPWAPVTDSIAVTVKGNTTVNFPVDPYVIVTGASFVQNGANIDATFQVTRVNTTRNFESAYLFLSNTTLVDNNRYNTRVIRTAAALGDISTPRSISAAIPAVLTSQGYLYARVGV